MERLSAQFWNTTLPFAVYFAAAVMDEQTELTDGKLSRDIEYMDVEQMSQFDKVPQSFSCSLYQNWVPDVISCNLKCYARIHRILDQTRKVRIVAM